MVNERFNKRHLKDELDNMSPNSLKHFHKLYDQRKYKSPRIDRSPIDIEYDRTKNDCKFKPEFFTKESKRAVSPRYMNKPEV